MAFQIYLDQTVVRANDTTGGRPPQFFNPGQIRYYILNGDYIIQDNVTGFRLNLGTFGNIQNEDGNSFANDGAVQTYLNSFINFRPGGGSMGVSSDHIFESAAARDTYFTANLNELIVGTPIIVQLGDDTTPDVRFQVWGGSTNPGSYDNTLWVDAGNTGLSVEQIALLTSLQNVSVNYIPLRTANGYENSCFREETDRIVSSKSIEAPGGTVYVSPNLGLGGAGLAFAVEDVANNRRGYLIAYERKTDGTGKPFYRALQALQTRTLLQPLQDANSASNSFNVGITGTANRLITRVYAESPDTGTANIQLLYGDMNGEVVATMNNIAFTADTEIAIDLPTGLFIETGQQYTIVVNGVRLKGTGTGANFAIFFGIDWHQWALQDLATEQFARDLIQPSLSVHNLSLNIPSRIDLNTALGSRIATFDVTAHREFTSLVLEYNSIDVATLVNPTTDGEQSQSVDLTAIDTSIERTLAFRLKANGNVFSNMFNVSVRNNQPHELLYWDVEGNNSPSGFDYQNAQSKEGFSGEIALPTFTGSQYVKIAYPANQPAITALMIGGVNQLPAFILSTGALTINSVSYNVLVSRNPVLGDIVSGEILTIIR